MVPATCAALMSGTGADTTTSGNANAYGRSEIDNVNTIRTSWWCSNGLYKNVTTATSAVTLNSQQTITSGQNKRQELAQVGCPNAKLACNTGTTVAVGLTNASVNAAKRDIVMPLTTSNGMTTGMKCTWVTWSVVAAPSWTLKESTNIGLTGSNW